MLVSSNALSAHAVSVLAYNLEKVVTLNQTNLVTQFAYPKFEQHSSIVVWISPRQHRLRIQTQGLSNETHETKQSKQDFNVQVSESLSKQFRNQ